MSTFSMVKYDSDTTGTSFQVKQLTEIAALAGNTVEARGAHPRLPSYLKPRYILYKGATTGQEHKLMIGEVGNALWTAPVGLVKWIAERGATVGEDVDPAGRVGEKNYNR